MSLLIVTLITSFACYNKIILTLGYSEMKKKINNTAVNIIRKLMIVNFITEQHYNVLTVKDIIIILV